MLHYPKILKLVALSVIFTVFAQAEPAAPPPSEGRTFRVGCGVLLAGLIAYNGWGRGWFENPAKDFHAGLVAKGIPHPASVTIRHVGQTHYHPFIETIGREKGLELAKLILTSQMNIVAYIRQQAENKDRPLLVFDEARSHKLAPERYQELKNRIPREKLTDQKFIESLEKELGEWEVHAFVRIQEAFPDGIPRPDEKGHTSLTARQANLIVKLGGTTVLWGTGELPTVHPAGTDEAMDKGNDTVERYGKRYFLLPHQRMAMRRDVYHDREKLALELAMRSIAEDGRANPNVILVYGREHDFTKYGASWLKFETVDSSIGP